MMKRLGIGSLILGVLVVCSHSQSIAATHYVATTGSDANSGTKTSPFRAINRGVKALVSGDTLFINPGVYAEELKNPLPSGLSASQPTKMTGPAASRPIIRQTTSNNGGYIILLNSNRTHITFENLVLEASAMPVVNSALATNSMTMITNLVLQNCEAIGRTGTTPYRLGGGDWEQYPSHGTTMLDPWMEQ